MSAVVDTTSSYKNVDMNIRNGHEDDANIRTTYPSRTYTHYYHKCHKLSPL